MNVKKKLNCYFYKTKLSDLGRSGKEEWLNIKVTVTLNGGNATIKRYKNSYKRTLKVFIKMLLKFIYYPS